MGRRLFSPPTPFIILLLAINCGTLAGTRGRAQKGQGQEAPPPTTSDEGQECSNIIRQHAAQDGPWRPRATEVWLDVRGRCELRLIYAVTYATRLESEPLCITAASAAKHGYTVNVIGTSRGQGFKREWFVDRIRALKDFALSLPSDSIILHFDAFDVLFNAPPLSVASHMVSSEMGVVFSAEKGCCSTKKALVSGKNMCDKDWPAPTMPTSMPWMNAGAWMGLQHAVVRMLESSLVEVDVGREEAMRARSRTDYTKMGDQQLLCEVFARGWDDDEGGPLRDSLSMTIDYASRTFLSLYSVKEEGDGMGILENGTVTWEVSATSCHLLDAQGVGKEFRRSCRKATRRSGAVRPAILHFNGKIEKKMHAKVAARMAWPPDEDTLKGHEIVDLDGGKLVSLGSLCGPSIDSLVRGP